MLYVIYRIEARGDEGIRELIIDGLRVALCFWLQAFC